MIANEKRIESNVLGKLARTNHTLARMRIIWTRECLQAKPDTSLETLPPSLGGGKRCRLNVT
jgi:hypothetical protein